MVFICQNNSGKGIALFFEIDYPQEIFLRVTKFYLKFSNFILIKKSITVRVQASSDKIAENYDKLALDQQAFVKNVASTVSEKSDEVADCKDRTLGLQQAKDAEKVTKGGGGRVVLGEQKTERMK